MPRQRLLLLALASLLACLLVAPFAGGGGGGAPSGAAGDGGAPTSAPDALGVLHAWDRDRAGAWRRGDPAALAALYTPASRAGRADARLLAAYVRRGLRVVGLRMQVSRVRVVSAGHDRLVLVVTDRAVGAVAVRHGRRWPLPSDGWSRRRVVLVRGPAGGWRVDRVADQTWPASTAVTSGSANS